MPNVGKTNTQEAIRVMREEVFRPTSGDRSGVANVGVLLTDGMSNVDRQNTLIEAQRARDDDVAMYVIALGDDVDRTEVAGVAGFRQEDDSEYVYDVRNITQVDDVVARWTNHVCQ